MAPQTVALVEHQVGEPPTDVDSVRRAALVALFMRVGFILAS